MQQRVKVYARIRPSIHVSEVVNPAFLSYSGPKVTICPPFSSPRSFVLDDVYGPSSSHIDIYNSAFTGLVADFLRGYSCTSFVYGQTGSGKTHTIGFDTSRSKTQRSASLSENEGLCGILFKQIFYYLQCSLYSYNLLNTHVLVSLVQLYNDDIEDLLLPGRSLELRESNGSFYVLNATRVSVSSTAEAMSVIMHGLKNRTVAPTLMNKVSSRAHTILSVALHRDEAHLDASQVSSFYPFKTYVSMIGGGNTGLDGDVQKRKPRAASTGALGTGSRGKVLLSQLTQTTLDNSTMLSADDLQSCSSISKAFQRRPVSFSVRYRQLLSIHSREAVFYLCDLAGSERIKSSRSAGAQLVEASYINQSLSALGNVVSALSKRSQGLECAHIPYRNSLLTKLLKSSLQGENKTVVIVTLSPEVSSLNESLSTLMFAERCKGLLISAKPKAALIDKDSSTSSGALDEGRTRDIVDGYLSNLGISLAQIEQNLPSIRALSQEQSVKRIVEGEYELLASENVRLRTCLESVVGCLQLPGINNIRTSTGLGSARSAKAGNTLQALEPFYITFTRLCEQIHKLYQVITTAMLVTSSDAALERLIAICSSAPASMPAQSSVQQQLSNSNVVTRLTAVLESQHIPEAIHTSITACITNSLQHPEGEMARHLFRALAEHGNNLLCASSDRPIKAPTIPPFSYFKDIERLSSFISEMYDVVWLELSHIEFVFAGKQSEVDVSTAYASLVLNTCQATISAQQQAQQAYTLGQIKDISPPTSRSSSPAFTPPLPHPKLPPISTVESRPESISSDDLV